MDDTQAQIYVGEVVHKRVHPIAHQLRYKVFSMLVECDLLAQKGAVTRLFSINGFNLFSLRQKDYGDGQDLAAYLHNIACQAGLEDRVKRFKLLTYPRILGWSFNPLNVYFGLDADGEIALIHYEVNNTFGERKTYVIPVNHAEGGQIWQKCPKQFFVSPFNKVSGEYHFHIKSTEEQLTVGVALHDQDRGILRAHFRGDRHELSDKNLLKNLARTGFMTLGVVGGIHWHALQIWLKGLRTKQKPPAPENPVSIFRA